ncbi:MAG: hypothetical protein OXM02_07970 [Bacteroidota bacterium]|nr:hypothetical protein [Bacteroidota bacterium]
MNAPPTIQNSARAWADAGLRAIEHALNADGLTIISEISAGLEHRIKAAIEAREERSETLTVILDTPGGVVERIVRVLRHHYDEVQFIIPN